MVRGRILCAFVGEPAMLTPAQSPRTNVKSSGDSLPNAEAQLQPHHNDCAPRRRERRADRSGG